MKKKVGILKEKLLLHPSFSRVRFLPNSLGVSFSYKGERYQIGHFAQGQYWLMGKGVKGHESKPLHRISVIEYEDLSRVGIIINDIENRLLELEKYYNKL